MTSSTMPAIVPDRGALRRIGLSPTNGSGRGSRRAPPPRPLLAGGRAHGCLRTGPGRTGCPPRVVVYWPRVHSCPWTCSTQSQVARRGGSRTTPFARPHHWSWLGRRVMRGARLAGQWPVDCCTKALENHPRKGPIEGTRRALGPVNRSTGPNLGSRRVVSACLCDEIRVGTHRDGTAAISRRSNAFAACGWSAASSPAGAST